MQAHTGVNRGESLGSLISDIMINLPSDISFENAAGAMFQQTANSHTGLNELSPLDAFLKAEVYAFNELLRCIRTSLTQLQAVSL